MNIIDFILKTRNGIALSEDEIKRIVQGVTTGDIPDYQLSAWLMALYFQGMNDEEVTHLTHYMATSGDILNLDSITGIKVDKHSTGGVGDKVTLVLAPLVASAGMIMAKLSGRGLGHTGGTIDKLEAIPGFNTSLSGEEFMRNLKEVGIAVAGQTKNMAPADKAIYALRDVTGTVSSTPLIVSSILSKKLAAGADVIVLDVKYGSGAFMKDYKSARELAEKMVLVGKNLKRSVSVLLSDMDQPLGFSVGHTLEVEEAINTLKGEGPEDLTELCLTLGAIQLLGAKKVDSLEQGKEVLSQKLASGEALKKFEEMVTAQGGDAGVIQDYNIMPQAKYQIPVKASADGYIHHIQALSVSYTLKILGAWRTKKGDVIDLGVGVVLHKKQGEHVSKDETIATIYSNHSPTHEEAVQQLQSSYLIKSESPDSIPPLIGEVILSQ